MNPQESKPVCRAAYVWRSVLIDALKMDHDYEVAGYEGYESFLWDLDKLVKPQSYDIQLHPPDYPEEASGMRHRSSTQ